MENLLGNLASVVWYYPIVALCLGMALFYTIRLGFIQLRGFGHAIAILWGKYDTPEDTGQITRFQALSTALSGTIGLGNISGVAIAIAMGGPGAIFWMWIVGFLGMAAKFAEGTLGSQYREKDPKTGELRGGPMYYITKGLSKKWHGMAYFYAAAISLAAIGAGCLFQSHEAASVVNFYYHVPMWITGLLLAGLAGLVIVGGIKRIGSFAAKIVPVLYVVYLGVALTICALNFQQIPQVFAIIIQDAFTGRAAAGGAVGLVILTGIRRAVFSSEAGIGSASIAHAAAKTSSAVREGFVASLGPFIDTIIICSATAIVIILSGFYGSEMYQALPGSTLDLKAQNGVQVVSNAWQISHDNTPPSQPPFRSLKSEGAVLKYQADTPKNDSVRLPLQWFDTGRMPDGIRFSYYRQAGDLAINLSDENGKPLSSFILSPDTKSYIGIHPKTGEETTFFRIKGYSDTPNEWHSVAFLFTPEFKQMIRNKTVNLEFIVQGSKGNWLIDRIQAVETVPGIQLTSVAFDKFFPGMGAGFITIAVLFFAFSTIVTWSYYGQIGTAFLLGLKSRGPYRLLFIGCVFAGTLTSLRAIINFADLMLGLMVIPNAIALLLHSNELVKLSKEYLQKLKKGSPFAKPKPSIAATIDVTVSEKNPAKTY